MAFSGKPYVTYRDVGRIDGSEAFTLRGLSGTVVICDCDTKDRIALISSLFHEDRFGVLRVAADALWTDFHLFSLGSGEEEKPIFLPIYQPNI
jgi:hypothetical protein